MTRFSLFLSLSILSHGCILLFLPFYSDHSPPPSLSLLSPFSTAPRSPSEVARAHNKESYDFMAGGRQHRAFIGARFSRLIVDPVPPSVHALLHHTTSSFYHVVPVVRARVYTPYLPRCHGFGVISGRRAGIGGLSDANEDFSQAGQLRALFNNDTFIPICI